MRRNGFAICAIILFLYLPAAAARGAELKDVRFFRDHPALLDLSTLSIEVDKTVKKPSRARLGAFGIGGLNAFTLMGLSYPFNTYHNTATYYFPFFGDSRVALEAGGKEIDFPKDAIWYVRGASVAVTREEDARLSMFTVNFSPPETGALVRVVILSAREDVKGARLFAELFGGCETKGGTLVQTRDTGARTRTLTVGSLDGGAGSAADCRLTVDVPELKKGDEKVFYFYYAIQTGENPGETVAARLMAEKTGLLDETVAYWRNYLAGSTRLVTPDARLNDMVENQKIAERIQRNGNNAMVVVVKYADRSHDRENLHVTRYYLMMGMPEDARAIMMYGYYAAQVEGAILNSQAADLDISRLPASVDWEHIPLDNDDSIRHVAERPSWTILMYYRYFKQTGDLDTIRTVYPYLRRNLVGQEITPEGLMPFHGDEMGQITIPTYISSGQQLSKFYSFESSFAFSVAARGMEEIADALGKPEDRALFAGLRERVETAAEKYYWMEKDGFYAIMLRKSNLEPIVKPFPLVSLNAITAGYDKYPERFRLNLLNTIDALRQKDGSIRMARGASLYHGQLQGEYLFNLKYFHHPLAARMFYLLVHEISDPAGMLSEAMSNSHAHLSLSIDQTGKAKEDARRFGPWESALDVASVVYYLTGMSADARTMEVRLVPEMPKGWDKWELRDGAVKKNHFDFFASDDGKAMEWRFVNKGPEPLNVSLELPIGKRRPARILIDGAERPLTDFTLEEAPDGTLIKGIGGKVEKEFTVRLEYE